MINFHCTIIPVVVLDSVITHTSAWFLNREIHQLVSNNKRNWHNTRTRNCEIKNVKFPHLRPSKITMYIQYNVYTCS